jgi:LysR family transcriptional regulator, low CO2-responsive transcriptional regulator
VKLGMGLAVVNACCRIPAGVVTRPMPELPALQYFVFWRSASLSGVAQALKQNLLAHANAWQDGR